MWVRFFLTLSFNLFVLLFSVGKKKKEKQTEILKMKGENICLKVFKIKWFQISKTESLLLLHFPNLLSLLYLFSAKNVAKFN